MIDPEEVIAFLDAQDSRQRADAENSQAAMVPLLLLGAVADVGSLASHHHSSHNTLAVAAAMESDAARRQANLTAIEMDRQSWADLALRRNSLFPGRAVAGLLFVPIRTEAQNVWIQVQVGGRRFPFAFEQSVSKVR